MQTSSWSAAALYRAVWRWHFYAGLFCAPFLFVLAVTGAIYLFNDEINDFTYPHLRFVPVSATSVPLGRMAEAALAQWPRGKVTRIDTPKAPGRSVEVFVTPASGLPQRVFVDPGTGQVLGAYVYARTLVGLADVIHGSLMLGAWGDALVELAACWGFVLTVTGLYLWWPRTGAGALLLPRRGLKGRAFWKDWHATIGLWTALLVLFLILTGLPWAGLWGDMLRRGADFAGLGYPSSHRGHGVAVTSATVKQATDGAGPWTTEAAPAPASDPHAHHHPAPDRGTPVSALSIGVDRVAEIVAGAGMAAPYRLNLPRAADGAYMVFTYPDQPEGQRTLYIDQYSGRVIDDVGFRDYGAVAKAVELGVQIHMGNYFGRLNQILMLLPCLGLVVLCVTGPYMWWRRRPKGRFAAPRPLASASGKALALLVLAVMVPFPLAGASLILCLAADSVLRRYWLRTA